MDDQQGTERIPNPSDFTVSLEANGHSTFEIDCNEGAASWKATSSDDARSGTLSFESIEITTRSCVNPEPGKRVATALADVRGYLIKDGQLHMSLLADGGILTWEKY